MPKAFECTSGTYTGNATARSIEIGFKPNLLILFNETDGDTVGIYIDGMADDKAIVITTDVALDAADGITLDDLGFNLGTGAECNENLKVYKYVAIGGN